MLLEFCIQKDLCVANTWFKMKEKRTVGSETEIDFVSVENESKKFLKDIKVIPWKLQHRLVVVDKRRKIRLQYAHKNEMEYTMEGMKIKKKRNNGKI